MLRKVNAVAAAAVMAAGVGGALRAQAATAVAVPCSAQALADAMAVAASGTTLSLAAGCVYNLTAALPEVSQVLAITGNGATLQRSHAAGTAAFSIVTVTGSGVLTVSELNFRHGDGAIAVTDQAQLTVNGGTFTGNTAEDGGAIFSDAIPHAPQINDATFVRNTATGEGGADIGLGGAIANYSQVTGVTVNGSVFIGNKGADGGAIWDIGEAGEISTSTFRGNTAENGGAVWLEGQQESLTDVVIRHNSGSGDGGGIYNATEDFSLINSTVSGNHAGGQGGGLYEDGGPYDGQVSGVSGSRIKGNSAADGGGIYDEGPVILRLIASTVSGNQPDNCAPPGSNTSCTG